MANANNWNPGAEYLNTTDLVALVDILETELAIAEDDYEEAIDALSEARDSDDYEEATGAAIEARHRKDDAEEAYQDARSLLDELPSEAVHGIPLYHHDTFEALAIERACDLGLDIDQWPLRCIEWAQAAEELRDDYTHIEIDGEDYYYLD